MLKLCSMAVSTFFFNDEQQHIKNLSLILIFIAHTDESARSVVSHFGYSTDDVREQTSVEINGALRRGG